MKQTTINIKMLCLTALFTALTTVATMAIAIPLPTGGYINFGDSVIYLTAVCLGGVPAAIAGGIGSMIADLILAPVYAPFTLVIKALEGLIIGLILTAFRKTRKNNKWLDMTIGTIGMLMAATTMVILYYFTDCILYGSFAGAVATFIPNTIQGSASVAIGFTLCYVLQLKRVSMRLVGDLPRFLNRPHKDIDTTVAVDTNSSATPPTDSINDNIGDDTKV